MLRSVYPMPGPPVHPCDARLRQLPRHRARSTIAVVALVAGLALGDALTLGVTTAGILADELSTGDLAHGRAQAGHAAAQLDVF